MNWNNRLTELIDSEYPIMQGALSRFGDWKFAAIASESGAHGCITAAVSGTPEQLRKDIQSCRELTKKAFSVNVSVGQCPFEDEMLEVALDEGVHVIETAVYNADKHGKRIKDAGRVWIHKAATVHHCQHAVDHGADAVILVGLEGIGYKNMRQMTTWFSGIEAARKIKVPVILSGGIGNGAGLVAALGTGCAGIMMGTRFMSTVECPSPEKFKKQMITGTADHPKLRYECLNMPDLKEYEKVMAQRPPKEDRAAMQEWMPRLERVMLKHGDWQTAERMWETPIDKMAGLQSMAVQYVDRIQTVKELVDSVIKEAEEIINGQFASMFK